MYAGHFHLRPRPSEHDGPAGHQGGATGYSGNESDPNHANYDPAKANPFPDLPDPLTTKDGKKVTTPEMWWKQRRPEIVEDYEREVYGRLPKNIPKVTWTVTITDQERVGFMPVVAKRVIGHVDNSGCPQINVDISMTVVLPAQAKGRGAGADDVRPERVPCPGAAESGRV